MTLPDQTWVAAAGALCLLIAPAILLAMVLRRSGSPGGATSAAIIAGIFVGLIAGPGVLGRARPDLSQPMFVGGVEEAQNLSALRRQQMSDLLALEAVDASPAALTELASQHARARAGLEAALDEARFQRRQFFDLLTACLIALHLLGAAGVATPAREALGRRTAASLVETRGRPVAVGLLFAIVSVVIPAAFGLLFLNVRDAAALGLMVSIPAVSISLGAPMLLACAVAALLCGAAALTIAWTPPFTIAVAGLLGGLLWPLASAWRTCRSWRRRAVAWGLALTLPAIAALLAARLDVISLASQPATSGAFWVCVIVGLLWSSDGRMIALWFACRTVGWSAARARPWSAAVGASNAGAGVMQLALAGAMAPALTAPEPLIAGAIVGAALVEISRGARTWFARLVESEEPDAAG